MQCVLALTIRKALADCFTSAINKKHPKNKWSFFEHMFHAGKRKSCSKE